MRLFYILFSVLLSLLLIILIAAISVQVPQATGIHHPEYPGMFISPANIDDMSHTRWLGLLFGVGIIGLFTVMLFIGNRKKGKITSMGKWLGIAMLIYLIVYFCMVVSHWQYNANEGGVFILSMPVPTAWMIYAVWFIPMIITLAFVFKFEDSIISEEEIQSFHVFLEEQNTLKS